MFMFIEKSFQNHRFKVSFIFEEFRENMSKKYYFLFITLQSFQHISLLFSKLISN